jgi:16S rRNA (guanine966-N2)-methyltransferase
MRIVAGRFRGKQLKPPKSDDIRPTADRVRESLFNILSSRLGPNLDGLRVLDLFAGTGALGLEAISRGASFAIFVDSGVEARGLIRDHIESFGLGGQSKLLRRDATGLGPVENFKPFDLIFLDPPYSKGLGEKALISAHVGGWIASGATIVLEERKGAEINLPQGFAIEDRRDYGDTSIWFMKATA